MVKFDIQAMRFLDAQHFRVLTAIEMGMKNHELVPLQLVSSIASIHRGATSKTLNDLTRNRIVVYERGKKFDGFRLTTLGYDFLALRALCSRSVVHSVGNQIGVGKESDIYVGADTESNDIVLKFHRLGRTSFRKIKEKRDYHQRRHFCSWLYLSRLAAIKEHAFLCALHAHGFPVPKPIDINRHVVLMQLITGPTLCHVSHLEDPLALFDKLMKLIVRLGSFGLIHGDFNEFNIMLVEGENPIIIDFPQMVSIDHPNAEFYFNRDVQCVRSYFKRKFHFESEEWPKFDEIERRHNLDIELAASGFTKEMRKDLNKAYDEGNFAAHLEEECSSDENGSGEDNNDDEDDNEEREEEKEFNDDDDGKETDDYELHGTGQGSQCHSARFQNWLEQAKDDLGALKIEEDQTRAAEEMVEEMEGEREAKAREIMGRVGKREEKSNITGVKADEEEEEQGELDERNIDGGREHTVGTRSAVGSTVLTAKEIKRRLLLERGNAKKEKLRVKGKQSAVRRGRQQNRELIREYAGWDHY